MLKDYQSTKLIFMANVICLHGKCICINPVREQEKLYKYNADMFQKEE